MYGLTALASNGSKNVSGTEPTPTALSSVAPLKGVIGLHSCSTQASKTAAAVAGPPGAPLASLEALTRLLRDGIALPAQSSSSNFSWYSVPPLLKKPALLPLPP